MPRQSTKTDRVLCIDTDSAVYACAFIAEKKEHYALRDGKLFATFKDKRKYNAWFKELDKETQDSIEYDFSEDLLPESESIKAINKWMSDLLKLAGSTRRIVLLTKGGECFRTYRATLKKYKGNRDDMVRPRHYQAVRDHLIKNCKGMVYAKWEADDAACMFMHASKNKENQKAILAAIDKDLDQQEGWHVNPNKKDEGVFFVSGLDGLKSFYRQMLTGDVADNIPGLKGVGEKHKWVAHLETLETPQQLCKFVYDCYLVKYGEEVTYTPWWWDTKKYDALMLLDYPDTVLVHKLRGKYPDAVRTVPTIDIFRENADLLYMLRTPDDQYTAHCPSVQELITPYPKGIVKEMLGD